MHPDDMPPPSDDALRAELDAMGFVLGEVIGLAPVPGSACDAEAASVLQMSDGTVVCRCVVCPRCGHHTGNSHQGHNWGMCKVTRTVRVPHFCCGNEFGCELETEPVSAQPEPVLRRHADHDPALICRPALGYGLCEVLGDEERYDEEGPGEAA